MAFTDSFAELSLQAITAGGGVTTRIKTRCMVRAPAAWHRIGRHAKEVMLESLRLSFASRSHSSASDSGPDSVSIATSGMRSLVVAGH